MCLWSARRDFGTGVLRRVGVPKRKAKEVMHLGLQWGLVCLAGGKNLSRVGNGVFVNRTGIMCPTAFVGKPATVRREGGEGIRHSLPTRGWGGGALLVGGEAETRTLEVRMNGKTASHKLL